VFKPYLGPETIAAATEALEMGWLGMGSYVARFEEELTSFLELPPERRLVAVNTGTSALHLALLGAGVGPGDEVITPSLNNIGDFQAIGMCGARPVFADIRPVDLGIDVASAERVIGPKTKAIIGLHYMGIPCDRKGLYALAEAHDLRVIEDVAHAVGTRDEGHPIGHTGDFACFSFDAIKTLTCIDGGAVVAPSHAEADSMYPARLLGMTQPNDRLYANQRAYAFDVYGQGYRYHLANLHAAIGLTQLRNLPMFIENRRSYSLAYNEALAGLDDVVVPSSSLRDVSVFNYVIRVQRGMRGALAAFLRKHKVETGIHWVPGHRLSWLASCRGADALPVTDEVGDQILTLPLWSEMADGLVAGIAERIRSFFGSS
jgi:dTDP-4-amino-4,6-dideoxygalactose transaminase